jgi:hypothetical protein
MQWVQKHAAAKNVDFYGRYYEAHMKSMTDIKARYGKKKLILCIP